MSKKPWFAFPLLTVALAVFLELGLWGLHAATGLAAFAPLEAPLPSSPDVVKIAIFGQSPMTSFGTPRRIDDFLRRDLERLYPGRKFFIRNFATLGMPFYEHQSRLMIWNLRKYDIVLAYVGLSEHQVYIDESGLFKSPGERHYVETMTPFFLIRDFIDTHSRLYATVQALLSKARTRYGRIPPPQPVNHYQLPPGEIQEPLFPDAEKKKIEVRFEHDLNLVAEASEAGSTPILFNTVILQEMWKPCFSTHRPGLTPEQRASFDAAYARALAAYGKARYREALPDLMAARAIDPTVAIVNHRIGRALWELGRREEARPYLKEAIARDGIPFRYSGPLDGILRRRAADRRWKNFGVIDNDKDLAVLLRRGYSFDDLFVDMEHPSMLGKVLLAGNFICRIAALPRLQPAPAGACKDWSKIDLKKELAGYEADLKVTDEERAEPVLQSLKWHFQMASMSAYPEDFLGAAEDGLRRYRTLALPTPTNAATSWVIQALIDARRGRAAAALESLSAARAADPRAFRSWWLVDLGGGSTMESMFGKLGIIYETNLDRLRLAERDGR